MADIPELSYGTVTGTFLAGVADTSDPERAPDAVPLEGRVIFTASVPILQVPSNPAIVVPRNITVDLVDGKLADSQGEPSVTLWATDDVDANPVNWTWRAAFFLTFNGEQVTMPSINFALPGGTTLDLASAPVMPASPGTEEAAWSSAVTATTLARNDAQAAAETAVAARDAAQAAALAAQSLGILGVDEPIPAGWPSKIVLREGV